MEFVNQLITLAWMVFPLFILALAFGALIETGLSKKWVVNQLGSSKLAIFKAIGFAALIPGCACATMPIAESLKNKGSSKASLIAFVMSSPLLGPHTILLTFSVLGVSFGFARIVFSVLGSLLLALFVYFMGDYFVLPKLTDKKEIKTCCVKPHSTTSFIKVSLSNFLTTFKKLFPFMCFGLVLAALIPLLMPESWMMILSGKPHFLLYVLASLIAIPLYVCEAEEIPLTFALLSAQVSPALAFSFMLASVGTCIPTALMAKPILGTKLTLFYLVFWLFFASCSGYVLQHSALF